MGDLLFAIANLSRKLGIEPESALRQANDKFTRRFSAMESALRAGGRALADCSLQEMEDEWGRVKQAANDAGAGRGMTVSLRPVNVSRCAACPSVRSVMAPSTSVLRTRAPIAR